MINSFVVSLGFILLLISLTLSVILGRNVGLKHLQLLSKEKLEIVGVAESSVFALLALLIAFTFSGAYDRYETRKLHLVEEADAFGKAYNYSYLIPKNVQATMQQDIRNYLDCYLTIFRDVSNRAKIASDLERAEEIEAKVWQAAVKASEETTNKALAQVYLPAFNDMFEAAHVGYYLTQMHPPRIIFVLLVALALLGGFLVGYTSAETKQKRPIHSICYVVLTTVIIYVIINIEYPRMGIVDMDAFDKVLIQVRQRIE
jgi:hypothetical protein